MAFHLPWAIPAIHLEDDSSESSESESESTTETVTYTKQLSRLCTFQVRDLFQNVFTVKLPTEIVNIILDMAEYWAHSTVIRSDAVSITEHTKQRPYVSIGVEAESAACIRRVVFTTESHDQGKQMSHSRLLFFS